MSVEAKTMNFSIQLEQEKEGSDITNVSVYLEGKHIGTTDENGLIRHEIEIEDTKYEIPVKQTYSLKKEGFEDRDGILFVEDNRTFKMSFGVPIPVTTPLPTVKPLPPDYQSPEQRIEELENTTQEQETRLTALETLIQKITEFLKTLGFKE